MRGVAKGTRGFAAVDALVALSILAAIFALGLEAMISSRRIAFAASEAQQATILLRYLLAREAPPGLDETGSLSGFNWRVQTAYLPPDPGAPAVTLCRRWAGATGARSGRRYVLSTVDFCARAKAAS